LARAAAALALTGAWVEATCAETFLDTEVREESYVIDYYAFKILMLA
jgi:hypothetical protein